MVEILQDLPNGYGSGRLLPLLDSAANFFAKGDAITRVFGARYTGAEAGATGTGEAGDFCGVPSFEEIATGGLSFDSEADGAEGAFVFASSANSFLMFSPFLPRIQSTPSTGAASPV